MDTCDCCGKARRDLAARGEVAVCFVCRVELDRNHRVYNAETQRYEREVPNYEAAAMNDAEYERRAIEQAREEYDAEQDSF